MPRGDPGTFGTHFPDSRRGKRGVRGGPGEPGAGRGSSIGDTLVIRVLRDAPL